MTNPAEKIRQVVEDGLKAGGKFRSKEEERLIRNLCYACVYDTIDAITDSLNEVTMSCWNTEIALREAGLEMQERATATKREQYVEVIQMLEEARSSLLSNNKE